MDLISYKENIDTSTQTGKILFTMISAFAEFEWERRALAICKRVAEEAKIKSNAFLHKFRHTYATILVQRGERL